MKPMQIAIAADQLVNTLLAGMSDETLSARAWRNHLVSVKWRFTMNVIDAVFFWQQDHCKQSYFDEFERKHLPLEYSKEQ